MSKFDGINVGGLWKGKSKAGATFLSGALNKEKLSEAFKTGKTRVLILTNKNKKEKKHPDFNMFAVEERDRNQNQKTDSSSSEDDFLK